jgi:hypothetical protein
LAVTPDGVLHVLWFYPHWTPPDAEHPRAATGLFYSASADGGATYSKPTLVAEHAGANRISMLSLSSSLNGSLLAVWSEADSPTRTRGTQARQTLRYVHTVDQRRWTDPTSVGGPPTQIGQGLPAVASTDSAWYVLSFDAGPQRTTVRLYRSDHHELLFRPYQDLATLEFGRQDIYLHGSYQVRFANDLVNIGDYVGLAGSNNNLAVALVLPTENRWPSVVAAYAGYLSTISSE